MQVLEGAMVIFYVYAHIGGSSEQIDPDSFFTSSDSVGKLGDFWNMIGDSIGFKAM